VTAPKILLVASDKARRPALSGLLKGLGCQVLTTISAENALAAIDGYKPDILLADMEIEDMNSNEFLKTVKDNPKWKGLQVITYTKLLSYKLTDPGALSTAPGVPKTEDSEHALEVLKAHIGPIPGEIVLWVEEAITKLNTTTPPLLSAAFAILKKNSTG